jgi:hypothetical protein
MTMASLAYRGLATELDRRQFNADVPALVMRQPRVGWGGQVSYRILGLKLALAVGRRAVFWGHDDPPYGQAFMPMFMAMPLEETGAVPFDLDADRDAPIMICDYLEVERRQARSWPEIEALADARIATLLGLSEVEPLALTGTLLGWMRLVPDVSDMISDAARQLGVGERTLGIHLRRGDKQIESAFIPPAEFNRRIAALHARWPFDTILLASDYAQAPSLLTLPDGVRLIFDTDEKRYNNANAKMLDRTPDLMDQETQTAARNVFLLAACGGLIGQENGNFGRLAAAVIAARGTPLDRIDLIDARRLEQDDPIRSRVFRVRRLLREAAKWMARRLGLLR